MQTPLLVAVALLAVACATEEITVETWVHATVDGELYAVDEASATLNESWSPNHLQMWSEDPLTAIMFDWPVGAIKTWDLVPVTGEGVSALFWYEYSASTFAWMSTSGTFEIATFRSNPEHNADDLRLGWITGTFEGTLQHPMTGSIITITDGMYRALISREEGFME